MARARAAWPAITVDEGRFIAHARQCAEADRAYGEALAITRDAGDKHATAAALMRMAIRAESEETAHAAQLFSEALATYREVGESPR